MPEAKLLKINENSNKYNCNICSDIIEDDKIIQLKCNKNHIFCYDCITDWYSHLKKKKDKAHYSYITQCPMCRKDGGLLPLCDGYTFSEKIHITTKKINNVDISVMINPDKKADECGVKLVYGNSFCKSYGKCNGFCKKHFNIMMKHNILLPVNLSNNILNNTSDNTPVNVSNNVSNNVLNNVSNNNDINPLKLPHECGAKLKTKKGCYCTSNGKSIYGGFCGIHKFLHKIETLDNVTENILVI